MVGDSTGYQQGPNLEGKVPADLLASLSAEGCHKDGQVSGLDPLCYGDRDIAIKRLQVAEAADLRAGVGDVARQRVDHIVDRSLMISRLTPS